jgi:hypothetical protein
MFLSSFGSTMAAFLRFPLSRASLFFVDVAIELYATLS